MRPGPSEQPDAQTVLRRALGGATFVELAARGPRDGPDPSSSPRDPSHTPGVAGAGSVQPPALRPWPGRRALYLRAFCSRCRQSMASGQCLRDCRKRCTWGRRMLLGGKRPVHSQSSSQPRSSLYLQGEAGVQRGAAADPGVCAPPLSSSARWPDPYPCLNADTDALPWQPDRTSAMQCRQPTRGAPQSPAEWSWGAHARANVSCVTKHSAWFS